MSRSIRKINAEFAFLKIEDSMRGPGNLRWVSKSQSLQSVIDSCDSPAEDNSYVIMQPPGIKLISEPLVLRDYVSIICDSYLGCIIKVENAFSDYILQGASHLSMRGLCFDADIKAWGAKFLEQTNFDISSCMFKNTLLSNCLSIAYSSFAQINKSEFVNSGGAGADGLSIESESVLAGEINNVSHDVFVTNCNAYNHHEGDHITSHKAGYEIEQGAYNIDILGCKSWNCEEGVRLYSGNYATKAFHDISVIGGRHCGLAVVNLVPGKLAYNLNINTVVDSEPLAGTELDVVPTNCFKIQNVERSNIQVIVNNKIIYMDGCSHITGNFNTRNYGLSLVDNAHCTLNVIVNRPDARPESLLTSDFIAGETVVAVTDGSLFEVGQYLRLTDDAQTNYDVNIKSISGNNVTLFSAIAVSLAVAENAKLFFVINEAVKTTGTQDDVYLNLTATGWANYSVPGSTGLYVESGRKAQTKTLGWHWSNITPATGTVFFIDPNGANRELRMMADAWPLGASFQFTNISTGGHTLTFDSTGIAEVVAQDQTGIFTKGATAWRKVYVG